MSSHIKLDELPNELLEKILLNLPIDQILLCKQMNKRFRWLISDYLRLRCLVISDQSNYVPANRRWFHTNQPVDCLHIQMNFALLKSETNRSMFAGLQKLFVLNLSLPPSDLIDLINRHQQLQQVQIHHLQGDHEHAENRLTISLSHLKILSIRQNELFAGAGLECVTFDTPSLVYLEWLAHSVRSVVFNYPKTVKQLTCFENKTYLLSLSELEVLHCRDFSNHVDDDFLSTMHRLKEIQFNWDENAFHKLKLQKFLLRRKDLQLYPLGIRFDKLPDFNVEFSQEIAREYEMKEFGCSLTSNSLPMYAANLFRLAPVLPFILEIHYSDLEAYLEAPRGMPADFLVKLRALAHVRVNERVNQVDQFINFLTICNHFGSIGISSNSLNQDFFDEQLPKLCPNLEQLVVFANGPLDYRFVLKFESLEFLELNGDQMKGDLLLEILDRFKTITLSYAKDGLQVIVWARGDGTYRVRTDKMAVYTNLNEVLAAIADYWPEVAES